MKPSDDDVATTTDVPERLVPPVPEPAAPDPSSRQMLRYYRENALRAWPQAAYEDEAQLRPLFGRASLLINRPEDIRRVLVDNAANYQRTRPTIRILRPILGDGMFLASGETWKHQRRVSAPAFAPRAVPLFARCSAEAFAAAAGDLPGAEVAGAELPDKEGGTVDLLLWLQHLALDVAGRALFSHPLGELAPRMRRLLVTYGSRYGGLGFLDFFLPLWLPNPRDLGRRWFGRRWFALIDELIAGQIERRHRQAPEPGRQDLFDLLVAARHPETGAAFGPGELRDQVATMLVAGHETTAVALFWSCYLLARSPHWQMRVAIEAAPCDLGPDGAAAALAHLPVTRAVIEEAMRLYPPVYVIVRLAAGPDRLAGRSIAPGTVVMVAPWVLHRHRRLWPEPDAFEPSRFMADAPPGRFAYLPFGVGPRVCIGAPLAMTEATIVLASLIQRFRIELVHRRPVLPVAVVTTQPDHAVPFRLTPR